MIRKLRTRREALTSLRNQRKSNRLIRERRQDAIPCFEAHLRKPFLSHNLNGSFRALPFHNCKTFKQSLISFASKREVLQTEAFCVDRWQTEFVAVWDRRHMAK